MMWSAGLVALLPLLFVLEEHCRGKWALERWKAKMTARGEKFEIERLIPASAIREYVSLLESEAA